MEQLDSVAVHKVSDSAFRQRLLADKNLRLELILGDGSTCAYVGTFYFAGRQVNENISQSWKYSSPRQLGQGPRGCASQQSALLVPQSAVSELQGG
jgi:hypothetical protein